MLDANINKKELTYGPVTLAYVEGKPVQSISGSNSMAESKSNKAIRLIQEESVDKF